MRLDIEQFVDQPGVPDSGGTQQLVDLALQTPERLTDPADQRERAVARARNSASV